MKPGAEFFAEIIGGEDPARVSEAADRAANLLVRGARAADDPAVAERVLRLADTEGIETIAEVWSGSPADSLAGCLWRLFVLRSWVYADPATVAREYDAGRRTAQVAQVVAGVADPPGPDELRTMVDEVLRGIAGSEFADVLFRAAAFARVVATGRAALDDATDGQSIDHVARMLLAPRQQVRGRAGSGRPAALARRRRPPGPRRPQHLPPGERQITTRASYRCERAGASGAGYPLRPPDLGRSALRGAGQHAEAALADLRASGDGAAASIGEVTTPRGDQALFEVVAGPTRG